MAEPVEEAVRERLARLLRALRRLARRLVDLARAVEDCATVGPVLDLGKRAVERLLRQPVPLAHVVRHVADDERARHVAEHERLVVTRPDVDHDRHPGLDRPRAHVVADGALRPGRDDEVVGGRAVRGERLRHRGLHALDRQRVAVDDKPLAVLLGAAKEVARRIHAGLCCALRAADPVELRVRLDAAAVVEEVVVDRELDAVGAQLVGEPERERLGDDRARDPERLHRAEDDLLAHLGIGEAGAEEVVGAVLLRRMQFEEVQLGEARDLHRADRDVLHVVLLRVEERIGNPDRDFVAKLGRAIRVCVHQDVWHARDSKGSMRDSAPSCTQPAHAGTRSRPGPGGARGRSAPTPRRRRMPTRGTRAPG